MKKIFSFFLFTTLMSLVANANCVYEGLTYPEKAVLVFPESKLPTHVCEKNSWTQPKLNAPKEGCKEQGELIGVGMIAKMRGFYYICSKTSKGFDWEMARFVLETKK